LRWACLVACVANLGLVLVASRPQSAFASEPDALLPGESLVVRAGAVVQVVGRPSGGANFPMPISADPTSDGATIRIFDTVTFPSGGAGDVTHHLDAHGWKALGRPAGSKGFRYRGRDAQPVDDVCTLVTITPTRIKAMCRGTSAALPIAPPFLGPAGVVLSIGTSAKRYCLEFGGDQVRNDAHLSRRTDAPAPSRCSELVSTPTATATATPTATPTVTPTLRSLEPLAVQADAQWVRDSAGRVVLLRGANYSGLEFGNFIGQTHGPEQSDFAQMEGWGFDVIRLPIAWNYLEPQPNVTDETYLTNQVDPVVGWADSHGMLVVLEMHQFQWSPCFTGGNGAPAWTCAGRGYSDDLVGVAAADCDFFTGATAPDGRTLMDHFVDVWRLVAHHYAGDRRIAGFDFFNEPTGLGCAPLPPGTFERDALIPFYRVLRAAVANEGATPIVFFDPPVFRNLGVGIYAEPMGPGVVYAPHLYTETFGLPTLKYDGNAAKITADYALAETEASTLGGPLVCGEYGGNTAADGGFLAATEQFVRDTLAEQDRRLVGGAIWAYFRQHVQRRRRRRQPQGRAGRHSHAPLRAAHRRRAAGDELRSDHRRVRVLVPGRSEPRCPRSDGNLPACQPGRYGRAQRRHLRALRQPTALLPRRPRHARDPPGAVETRLAGRERSPRGGFAHKLR
jgi:aryl-phospho-beta-D-glucosidase BglC (GH1 family)